MSPEQSLTDALGGAVAEGDVVAGKYRVDRLVGTGGMGIVVEAFHLHFEERVAIKFLLPQMGADGEAIERFEREARAAFKIKSEHVARVLDVGKLERIPFMVMEFLEGQDLGDMLIDRQPMPIEIAVTYVLQAVDAVAEAHALNIVHRDLKPENLFLTMRADGSPCIKVLDFGLSKIHAGEVRTPRPRAITAGAQAMGTPQYMSPEQWLSARDVGPPTDQWSLAVILFELITGQQPFQREHLAQLCTQVLRGDPEPFDSYRDDVPEALQAVVLRALSKEPDDRYPNLAAFAIDLVPFAPAMRGTVRRIKGIFQRIGVDTAEIPSSRRGGLGSLVLGGARPELLEAGDDVQSAAREKAPPHPDTVDEPSSDEPGRPEPPASRPGPLPLAVPRPAPPRPSPPSPPSSSPFASSRRLPAPDESTVVMEVPSRPEAPLAPPSRPALPSHPEPPSRPDLRPEVRAELAPRPELPSRPEPPSRPDLRAELASRPELPSRPEMASWPDGASDERRSASRSDVTQLLTDHFPTGMGQTTVIAEGMEFSPPPPPALPTFTAAAPPMPDAPTLVTAPPWQAFPAPSRDRRLPLVIAAAVVMCVVAVVVVIVSFSDEETRIPTKEQAE